MPRSELPMNRIQHPLFTWFMFTATLAFENYRLCSQCCAPTFYRLDCHGNLWKYIG